MPPLTSLSLLFMQVNNNRLSVSPFGALTISGWGWGEGQEHLGVSEDGARAWGHRRLAVAQRHVAQPTQPMACKHCLQSNSDPNPAVSVWKDASHIEHVSKGHKQPCLLLPYTCCGMHFYCVCVLCVHADLLCRLRQVPATQSNCTSRPFTISKCKVQGRPQCAVLLPSSECLRHVAITGWCQPPF